ncbi:hypothetical protein ACE7GA_05215 [Roseomonas sp. CCTCC AB2023176]|uniref:hypothetical protein n=1 Tax=Roseomonas sp. CCTCC AB2023176 TaxID=3342640 RepID=UPI0035E13013
MQRFAAVLAPLALAGALSACAVDPYDNQTAVSPYQGSGYPPTAYAAGPGYTGYATTYAPAAPAYGSGYAPAYGTPDVATARPDPTGYCREAYAHAADAQNRAAYSGSALDVQRAQNTANSLRRDC